MVKAGDSDQHGPELGRLLYVAENYGDGVAYSQGARGAAGGSDCRECSGSAGNGAGVPVRNRTI